MADWMSEGSSESYTAVCGVEPVRWVNGYSSAHLILLVGEGDFSFSLSLATSFGSASKLVATSLDSEDDLLKKYSRARSNVNKLTRLGATVLHGVDATVMNFHPCLHMQKFDRIVFNFPHAGFKGREEDLHMIRLHRKLIAKFFCNAGRMLLPHGEIHVSHKTTQPFCDWGIEQLAANFSLGLIDSAVFNIADYPGYHNKRGDGGRCDMPFPLGKSSTYKFTITEPKKGRKKKRRNKSHSNSCGERNEQTLFESSKKSQWIPLIKEEVSIGTHCNTCDESEKQVLEISQDEPRIDLVDKRVDSQGLRNEREDETKCDEADKQLVFEHFGERQRLPLDEERKSASDMPFPLGKSSTYKFTITEPKKKGRKERRNKSHSNSCCERNEQALFEASKKSQWIPLIKEEVSIGTHCNTCDESEKQVLESSQDEPRIDPVDKRVDSQGLRNELEDETKCDEADKQLVFEHFGERQRLPLDEERKSASDMPFPLGKSSTYKFTITEPKKKGRKKERRNTSHSNSCCERNEQALFEASKKSQWIPLIKEEVSIGTHCNTCDESEKQVLESSQDEPRIDPVDKRVDSQGLRNELEDETKCDEADKQLVFEHFGERQRLPLDEERKSASDMPFPLGKSSTYKFTITEPKKKGRKKERRNTSHSNSCGERNEQALFEASKKSQWIPLIKEEVSIGTHCNTCDESEKQVLETSQDEPGIDLVDKRVDSQGLRNEREDETKCDEADKQLVFEHFGERQWLPLDEERKSTSNKVLNFNTFGALVGCFSWLNTNLFWGKN